MSLRPEPIICQHNLGQGRQSIAHNACITGLCIDYSAWCIMELCKKCSENCIKAPCAR